MLYEDKKMRNGHLHVNHLQKEILLKAAYLSIPKAKINLSSNIILRHETEY